MKKVYEIYIVWENSENEIIMEKVLTESNSLVEAEGKLENFIKLGGTYSTSDFTILPIYRKK